MNRLFFAFYTISCDQEKGRETERYHVLDARYRLFRLLHSWIQVETFRACSQGVLDCPRRRTYPIIPIYITVVSIFFSSIPV